MGVVAALVDLNGKLVAGIVLGACGLRCFPYRVNFGRQCNLPNQKGWVGRRAELALRQKRQQARRKERSDVARAQC